MRARLRRARGVADDELDGARRARSNERVDDGRRLRRGRATSRTSRSSPRGVYAPGSAEQFERMRPGSPFGELELVFDAGLGR